ncbi:protein translocase subunit SecD [Bulleidia sp. zg-1006]|uniref:protein translocase subunit SecD n=1 Tax=Bulleidia sp. zg-1006 TaxID=2806552 RepID=UPI00193ACDB4|nr:protein translocase subunit SecD [Bulleidia sp. zg-1006]QRG86165.1 protein translocase subunit SecD [Bulleidia sp. zg-1006]
MPKKKNKRGSLGVFGLIVALLIVLASTTYKTIIRHINLGLDLQGGFEILYQIEPLQKGKAVDMPSVINSISKRVNVLGVNEPQISVEGNNRVRVQLAGAKDLDTARKLIGTTAKLTFRDVNDKELADSSILQEGGASLAYQNGEPVVSFKVANNAKFQAITREISRKTKGENVMVIWLDYKEGDSYKAEAQKQAQGKEPKYVSAASVNQALSGDSIIQGNFTEESARTLANLINSGSLPVKLNEISSNVVSAAYGQDALSKTAFAGMIGVGIVMLFMIFMYRLPGIIASIMLISYIWAVFGIYALMGATFTLSGIGALVLGIGMTVDANIVNYERIRQEMYAGKSIRTAVKEGQKLSFAAVFDAQFTTLIAALIMYIWGSGTVKGFATMLMITVFMTLVLNVGLSKILLDLVVKSGVCDNHPTWFAVKPNQIPDVSNGEKQFYTGTHHVDYVGKAKYLIRTAIVVIALFLGLGIFNQVKGNGFFNLGIDFSSGTKLTVASNKNITTMEVQKEFEKLGLKGYSFQASGDKTVYATTKQAISTEQLTQVKKDLKKVYGQEPGDNIVTPVVGRDLVHNAFILTIVAWIAMMSYVTIRYEWDYALSCLLALVHDVLIVLAVFGILRLEVNIELISVLLTIIGYSINNSIIVFDRIREQMRLHKNKASVDYKMVVNDAIDATIKEALNSSFTTIVPVIILLAFGSRAIFTFIFAMLVGLMAGTFSSIFISPILWNYIRTHHKPKEKNKKKKESRKEHLDEYTIPGINA